MSTEPAAQESMSDSRLANLAARHVADAYAGFETRFRIVTRRARIRFPERDWKGMAADARERLDLYERAATGAAQAVRGLLASRTEEPMVWAAMKAVYSGLIQARNDWELAEYVSGPRITLLEMDVTSLLADEAKLKELQGRIGPDVSLTDVKPLLKDIKGIKIDGPSINVEFR